MLCEELKKRNWKFLFPIFVQERPFPKIFLVKNCFLSPVRRAWDVSDEKVYFAKVTKC